MSITPAGGWGDSPSNNDQRGQDSIPSYPSSKSGSGVVVAGYICCFIALLFLPLAFALAGFFCGVVALTKDRVGHGVILIVLGVSCGITGMFLGSLTRNTAVYTSAGSQAVSNEITYDLFSLHDAKNHIPTGTPLSVKGLFFQIGWTRSIRCDQLLMYGHAIVQHGEADPASYCRFTVSMSEKQLGGNGDTFPVYGAVCDVTPSELKKDLKLYHYGDQIQVHGVYAPSLDFAISPVGVPRLNNCTVSPALPSTTPKPPPPVSTTPDEPYNY